MTTQTDCCIDCQFGRLVLLPLGETHEGVDSSDTHIDMYICQPPKGTALRIHADRRPLVPRIQREGCRCPMRRTCFRGQPTSFCCTATATASVRVSVPSLDRILLT